MGAFLPFDKGLAPIANGTPWGMQAAFFTASTYHLLVQDTEGFIGCELRAAIQCESTLYLLI